MSIDPRIASAFEAQNGFPLAPHLVVLALMGSHSHGTYLPPEEPNAIDDVDLMGFVVPPLRYHLGLPRWQHWTLHVDELDVVLHSLEKSWQCQRQASAFRSARTDLRHLRQRQYLERLRRPDRRDRGTGHAPD